MLSELRAQWFSLSCGLRAAVEHRFHMDANVIIAALGLLVVIASAAFFFVGKKNGVTSEVARQSAAKATAEESAKKILSDAERESENLRKAAVVSGKEELIKLRENFEVEVRGRRE